MATLEDVGIQHDWHGQDCFMGIGGWAKLMKVISFIHLVHTARNVLRSVLWTVQMRLAEALFWGLWYTGVPTALSA
jgi:hypothetical protein